MLKNKIFSYFFIEFVKVFLLITLSLSILIWITQAARLLDLVTEFGNPISTYIKYLFFIYPKILENIYLLCFSISIFFLFAKFENSKEINIYWMSGISKRKIIKIILLISLILFFLYLLISTLVSPFSLLKGRQLLANSKFSLINSLVKEQNFNTPLKGLTIYVGDNDKKGKLKRVFIYEKSRTIYAKYGEVIQFNNNNILKLYDGITHEKDAENINIISFKETIFDFSEYQLQNITHPKFNERSLTWLINNLNNKDIKKRNEIREEVNKRTLKPFLIFIIASLGCFLLYSNEDKVNIKKLRLTIYTLVIALLILNQSLIGMSSQSIIHTYFYSLFLLTLFLTIAFVLNNAIKLEYS